MPLDRKKHKVKFPNSDQDAGSTVQVKVKRGNKVSVIEVKTGKSTEHASLDYVMDTYSKQLGQCYVLHTKDLRKDGNLLYLPIDMAICL